MKRFTSVAVFFTLEFILALAASPIERSFEPKPTMQGRLARRRLVVDDIDATLTCDGDNAVLVPKVETPREPHLPKACKRAPVQSLRRQAASWMTAPS